MSDTQSQFNVTGEFVVGVEHNGKLHTEFELRPELAQDTIAAASHPGAMGNDVLFGYAVYARRLVKIGDIPLDEITVEMFTKMLAVDIAEIRKADTKQLKLLRSFRVKDKPGAKDTPASASAGDTVE